MSELPFKKGLDFLHKCWGERGLLSKYSNASIVFQGYDDTVRHSPSQACHGGMGHPPMPCGSVKYIISGIQDVSASSSSVKLTRTEKITYLTWLLNNSVYSGVFITKDAEWCLDNEAIVARPDVPGNLLVAGLQSTRRLWEFTYVVKTFSAFVKAGVNPELAFFLGQGVRFRDNDIAFSQEGSDHYPIGFRYMKEVDVLQFLKKEVPERKLKKLWSESVSYQGIIKMFLEGETASSSNSFFNKHLKNFDVVEKVERTEVINPFLKSKKVASGDSNLKFFPLDKVAKEIAKNFQAKIFKKVGYAQDISG